MITEKQKEAVKELCQYVDNFCKENNLSAFMSVADNLSEYLLKVICECNRS